MNLLVNVVEKKYSEDTIFKNSSFKFGSNLNKLEGDNGSGKSTLLKMLSGKTEFKGDVYLNNMLIKNKYLSKNFVLVNQEIALLSKKTVSYNIECVRDKKVNKNIIADFGFSDKLNVKVETLSGGWKKKLMLLMAFVSNPKVLLLDEYTNYLDDKFIQFANEYILEFSKEHMVIYIDHNYNIGGEIVNISKNNDLIEVKNTKCLKNGKFAFDFAYFRNEFNFFKIISLLLIIFFSSLITFNISINNIDQGRLWSDYLLYNNINYIQCNSIYTDEPYIDETTYDPFYVYSTHTSLSQSGIYFLTYTDSLTLPILEEVDTPGDEDISNECFVTDLNEDLIGKTITYEDNIYFVKGVLNINTDNYASKYPYTADYLNSIFVESPVPDDDFDAECLYATDEEIEEEKDYVIDAKTIYFDFNDYINHASIYSSILLYVGCILFVGFILGYFFFTTKKEREDCFLLSHYNKSNRELRINRFISYAVKAMVLGVFNLVFAYIEYNCLVNYCYSFYASISNLNFNSSVLITFIYFVIFILIDFLFIKKIYDIKPKINQI